MLSAKWPPFCLSLSMIKRTHGEFVNHNCPINTEVTFQRKHFQMNFLEWKFFSFLLKFYWTLLKLRQHWFRWWLGTCLVPSHYLGQWWSSSLTHVLPGLSEMTQSGNHGNIKFFRRFYFISNVLSKFCWYISVYTMQRTPPLTILSLNKVSCATFISQVSKAAFTRDATGSTTAARQPRHKIET